MEERTAGPCRWTVDVSLSSTADGEGFSCSHTSHLKHLGNHQFSWRMWSLPNHKTSMETT